MSDARALALLVVAVAVVYASALGAPHFQFDDYRVVVDNADVHSWGAWARSMPGMRPLTKAVYTLAGSFRAGAAAFVAIGVAVHAVNASLVFWLARRWFVGFGSGQPAASAIVASGTRFAAPDRTTGSPTMAALVTALLFAVHPAQTEAVTYVAGQSVALSALGVLASLAAFERARDGSWSWRLASVLAFVAAMAARETAWIVPFACVLVELARGASLRAAGRRARAHVAVLAACAAAILALPAYRRLLSTSLAIRDVPANLVAQVDGVAYLVTHPLLTLRLNVDPDIAARPVDAGWWLAAGLIATALVVAVAQWRRRPWLGFGVLWFFLALAPTNGPLARLDLANDRQLYLALIGPSWIAGVVASRLAARRRVQGMALAGLVAAGCALATAVRNTDYRSETALWEATARRSPGKARVWNNLGYAYVAEAGDPRAARAAFERALALDPQFLKARINLDRIDASRR